jgi:hypothetical protein
METDSNEIIMEIASKLISRIETKATEWKAAGRPVKEGQWGKEPEEANMVREICREMLDAIEADGCYGCPLCRS